MQFGKLSHGGGYLEHFFSCRHPFGNLHGAGDPQRFHAVEDALAAQGVQVGVVADQVREALGDGQQLVDANPAAVAGLAAFRAADGAVDGGRLGNLPRAADALQDIVVQGAVRRLACRAQCSHQALGHDAEYRGLDQIMRYAELQQAADGAWRVVGVQGRQHQVPGQRRLNEIGRAHV